MKEEKERAREKEEKALLGVPIADRQGEGLEPSPDILEAGKEKEGKRVSQRSSQGRSTSTVEEEVETPAEENAVSLDESVRDKAEG